MRVLYILVMVFVALAGIAALRVDTATGAGFFLLMLVVEAGLLGGALLGRMPTGRLAEFWPVRMLRLWARGTEKRLKERAGETD